MLVDLDVLCRNIKMPLKVPTLSCCFSQLEILTLRLPMHKPHDIAQSNFPKMLELKKLTVHYSANLDESLLDLTTFMRISPNLEEFVLMIKWPSVSSWGSREVKKGTPFPHQHIKVFKYKGYYGHCSDLELVMFILENCVGLQEIMIDPALPLPFLHEPLEPEELEYEQVGRSNAKQQLEPIIPPHITLVIR
ncbi:unnamed protein product [Cuscuta epithymum]|uniref:At1g61320/AtMIF1 LRR domain-containing protein n=1 Tax=Cuscuta epithymum TaxID=186058 RepID=A0AAV0EC66_9ASTE|nr:unnamed protein product [Cuscuta epithymum]